ncbi:MAG: hypothetical protein ACJ790_00655 [Myxococcaceae bacterium]
MNARGQGTVELALGATLFVSVLLLGLYLIEVSFLSIKVQEASAATVWDATGRTAHDFKNAATNPGSVDKPYQNILSGPSSSEKALTARYKDFDALNKGTTGTARLFARGSALQAACERTSGGKSDPVAFDLPPSTTYSKGVVPTRVNSLLRSWYRPEGGTICTASANAQAFDLPKQFLDKDGPGGFFAKFRSDKTLKLCGAGRAVSGSCTAGYAVLLGDWGLDGNPGDLIVRDSVLPENKTDQGKPTNTPYRKMVEALFEESGARYDAGGKTPGAASRFAMRIGGKLGKAYQAPTNEKQFYMSYAGSEHDYVDMLDGPTFAQTQAECARRGGTCNPATCTNCHFNTAGTQPVNGNPKPKPQDDWENLRKPCFLGLGGCKVP